LQVNGIVREPTDAWSEDPSSSLGPVLARLDLGRSEKQPVPDRDAYRQVTILGTEGATGGFVYGLQRICDFLCGDEHEECHYEIAAGAEGSKMLGVGAPVLAIVGSHAVTDYRPVVGDPLELPGVLLDQEFASPIWPGPSAAGTEAGYRLRPPQAEERQVRIEYRWKSDGEIYGMDDSSCYTQSIAGLTRVKCSSFVLLADGPQ
ncbi:MAG: hypothetical protein GY716_02655, partial [bacterium]|nr:hypothetical protein [bacterium]